MLEFNKITLMYTQVNHIITIIKAIKTIVCITMFCVLPMVGFSTNYTATTNGKWSLAATWGGAGVPNSTSDNVTIPIGITVYLGDAAYTCASITIVGTLDVANTTAGWPDQLTATNVFVDNGGTILGSADYQKTILTFTNLTIGATGGTNAVNFVRTTNNNLQISISGLLTIGNSSATGTGAFNYSPNLNGGSNSLTIAAVREYSNATYTLNCSGGGNCPTAPSNNVVCEIVNSGAVYFTNTAYIVGGYFTNTSGTVSNSLSIVLSKDVTNTAGSITNVESTGATITVNGNLTNNATVNNNCGTTITVAGTFSQGASGVVTNQSTANKYSKFAVTTTGTNSGTFGSSTTDYIIYSGGTETGTVGTDVLNNYAGTPSCTASLRSPVLTAAVGATVDASFNVTFTNDATWLSTGGTVVKYGSNVLTLNTDYTLSAGVLTLIPSGSSGSGLRTAGIQTVTISKTGYLDATVSQTITAGVATKLAIATQPTARTLNGAAMNPQPVVQIQDQYGNVMSSSSAQVTATVGTGSGSWTIGGTTTVTAVNGIASFTNISANTNVLVSNATIIFTSSGLTSVTSNSFSTATPSIIITDNVGSVTTSTFIGCTPSITPSVKVTDGSNTPISGLTINFSVSSGGGTIGTTSATIYTTVTNGSGIANAPNWTMGTTGANSLLVSAVSTTITSAINYPFPQSQYHSTYPYGICASHPNYTRIQSLISTWITNYYREGTLPNSVAAARVQWDDTTKTVSEGMGYGMLILVYSDNTSNNYQSKFNKLWQYYNYYKDGNGLMDWQISGFTTTRPGTGAATDADIDVALAMIMAHKQWGSTTPDANGITINYLARANELFHAIYQNEVDGSHLLKPGDGWNSVQNPSYAELFAIQLAADEQTAGVLTSSDSWTSVYSAMQTYIVHYRNATTGLLPNWTDANTTGACNSNGYNANDNKCGGWYNEGCLYGIDALRVPWRLAWDYSWYGTQTTKTTDSLVAVWLRGSANNGPNNKPQNVKGMYNIDGSYSSLCSTVAGTVNGMGYIGGLTHAFMVDNTQQANLDTWYEYIQDTTLAYITTTDPNYNGGGNGAVATFTDYYNHTLQILYLLTTSGNTPNLYASNPQVNDGTPITYTSNVVTTAYSGASGNDLSNTSNWWTAANATGAHPCNFTTTGTNFIVQSGHSCSLSSNETFGAGVTLEVDGTLTPAASTVLSGNGTLNGSGTLVITRTTASEDNFDNQYAIATKTITGLTIDYAGSSAQNSTNNHTYNNLIINNAAGVTFNSNNSVTGTQTMTAGVLTTGANTIDLGATGTLNETVVSPTSYITGIVQATRNTGSSIGNQLFGGIGLEINETSQASNSTLAVRTTGIANNTSGHQSIKRYFTITPTTDAGLTGTMKFHYFQNELNGDVETRLALWKSTDSRVTWAPLLSSVDTVTNTLSLSGISSFSDWTASDMTSQLPISLLDFKARYKNDVVTISWTTLSETNNDYFTLERSLDGVNWEEIYTCKGAGSSNIIHNYSNIDYEQQSGTIYYRLKQTDLDGRFTYSNIESVSRNRQHSKIIAFPNPFDGKCIYITGLVDKTYAISLYNILGVEVYSTNIRLDGDVTVILDLDTPLQVGSYFIKCVSDNQSYLQELLVQ